VRCHAELDRRLNQVDLALEEAAKRGRTTTALSAMEGQNKGACSARGGAEPRGRQRASVVRYVAELIGADTDSEWVTRWLIALMVLCCDPLPIALTAAALARQSTTT
jgi:hypothetical protein